MSETEQAEKILTELRGKREVAVAHGVALGEERTQLAFGAHALGDTKSRKRLDEINRESALHDSELRSLDAAISEAVARVEAARQVEGKAAHREVAHELLKRAARLVQLGQTLDDANSVRVEASNAIADELTEMRSLAHGLGVHIPSHEQFLALGSRADQTATMGSAFARVVGEHLAPRERRTHQSYVVPWSDQIVKAARAAMGEKEEAA